MKNAPDKLQWHPAFCAAAGLEFHEDIERLELKPEYNLSKEPIRIDLLIIKEESDRRIKNEIGHIMRTYNVIEYKSPEDALTIDDFYKTVGYACLYKGYGERVDAVPINELTISIFREARPEKMFLTLQKYEHKIEEFLRNVEEMNTPRDRQNVEAVLQVSVKANDELYREIRRDANMCDALRELMKEDLEDARKLGESEGVYPYIKGRLCQKQFFTVLQEETQRRIISQNHRIVFLHLGQSIFQSLIKQLHSRIVIYSVCIHEFIIQYKIIRLCTLDPLNF